MSAERAGEYLRLDAATRRNLELTETLRGEPAPTLFSLLDECATGMGSRLLRHWLHHPLRDRAALAARHEAVAALKDIPSVQKVLRRFSDVERITARLALKSVRPRELAGLARLAQAAARAARRRCPTLAALLQGADAPTSPTPAERCLDLLENAIHPEPCGARHRRRRDRRRLQRGSRRAARSCRRTPANSWWRWKRRRSERTGIPNLRVAYNHVHGYYIEVTNSHAGKVPDDYRRRQTLKNAERYITPELKQFEDKALSARDRALALEKSLYEAAARDAATAHLPPLQRIARALAQADVLSDVLGRRAESGTTRGRSSPTSICIEIEAGRHPVVEGADREASSPTTAACRRRARLLLITGPNMGGKSTYMRQVALIVLLAHIGSFVPARAARIGPIDQIFTRIGAADDLAGGRSTFMVEMTESAAILHNATEKSLVLMDEVGRGTSTFDGLALAWAIAKHLVREEQVA